MFRITEETPSSETRKEGKVAVVIRGLTVPPATSVTKVDPEAAAKLAVTEREAAELAAALDETIKARDAQLARADETAIKIAGVRLASTAPATFVEQFCTAITEEYLRRLRGAVKIAQRAPQLFTDEMMIGLEEVRQGLEAIEDSRALTPA